MPKARKPPIVLTAAQETQSWLTRAENLRAIAASSRDPLARKVLVERAEAWEKRASEARAPTAVFSEPA